MMDEFDYTVMEFMKEYGFFGTYVKTAVGDYDPSTGEPSTVVTEIPVEVILMDLTLQSNGFSTKYGTLVQAGDKDLWMRPPQKTDPDAEPITIDPASDVVKLNGVTYKIVTAKETSIGGQAPLLYNFYIRR